MRRRILGMDASFRVAAHSWRVRYVGVTGRREAMTDRETARSQFGSSLVSGM